MTSADKPGALVSRKLHSGSAGEPELKGQQAKDAKAKEESGQYRKMRDEFTGALRDYDEREKKQGKRRRWSCWC